MNGPAPTPIPLHDIVGPVWFFPYPWWVVVCIVLAVLALFGAVILLVKKLLQRRHVPTPRERVLASLELLRNDMAGMEPYLFGIAVSDAIRKYIHEQHGLRAPTQTSIEFLQSIREHSIFTENEKAGLSAFLEGTDLLKYAHADASESDMIGLLETAGRLVRDEVQPGKKTVTK